MSAFNGTPYPLRPLGEVAKMVGGGTPSRSESSYFDGNIDWVTPTDLPPIGEVRVLGPVAQTITEKGLKNSSAKLVPPGSVLYSSRASIGKIAVTDRPCATNQGFANFLPSEKVDPWYLAFALSAGTRGIEALCGQTTFKEVSKKSLKAFEIPLPPLDEQRRLVARIRACLDRVDAVRQLREESTEAADLVESAVFEDLLADTGLIEDDAVPLGSVLIETQYGTSQKASPDGTGVPVLRMGNIQRGRLDVSDLKFVDLPPSEVEKYRLNDGDILFNRTNSLEQVGKAAVFSGLEGTWTAASYLIRLVVDPARADARFINAYINSRRGRSYIEGSANRAIGMVNVNAKKARALPVLLPGLDAQKRIADQLEAASMIADDLRCQQRAQAEQEAQLTQSILARAFAGEL